MKNLKKQPTNRELEILAILWELGKGTAREVHNILVESKASAYTTTLTTIQNMYEKGFLDREPKGQSHNYFPKQKKEVMQEKILGNFLSKVFKGSSKNMIMQTLGHSSPSKDELGEIKEMIEKLEKEGGKSE